VHKNAKIPDVLAYEKRIVLALSKRDESAHFANSFPHKKKSVTLFVYHKTPTFCESCRHLVIETNASVP
jgi:hypothetical protein